LAGRDQDGRKDQRAGSEAVEGVWIGVERSGQWSVASGVIGLLWPGSLTITPDYSLNEAML